MDQGTQRLIRRHNAQMRDLIVRDIDALEEKLNVKRQVSHLADNAVDTVKGKLGMNNSNPNESWVDFVRHNAVPLAAVGFGGAVLAKNLESRFGSHSGSSSATLRGSGSPTMQRTGASVGYPMVGSTDGEDTSEGGGLRDKVSGAGEALGDKASSAKDAVSGGASTAKDAIVGGASSAKDMVVDVVPSRAEAGRMARDHNQVLGMFALVAGAAAGAFVPRSKAEERRLAPVQESVREKASDLADQGVEKVKETAERAQEAVSAGVDTAKSEFEDAGDEEPPGTTDTSSSSELPDLTQPNRITGSRGGVGSTSL